MNIVRTWESVTNSLEDTLALAEKIGASFRGGEIIELVSDIGGGKTAFVRGLARGIGSTDQVASPTFTISRHYTGNNDIQIHHYDFYRLGNEPGLMQQELEETIGASNIVSVIEWADAVKQVLPPDRLRITIKVTGDDSRHFLFEAGAEHMHLEHV